MDLMNVLITSQYLRQIGGNGPGDGADWSASEGEAGYVKNRTHYEAIESTTLFDGECVDEEWGAELFEEPHLVSGQEYTITLDGNTYKCVAQWNDVLNSPLMGAPFIFEAEDFDFSEYPFAICGGNEGPVIAKFSDTDVHHLKLETISNVVHKLDEKFLPFGEFKMLSLFGNSKDGWFRCNLPFEEAFDWVESHSGRVFGIYQDQLVSGLFYLEQAFYRTEESGERYLKLTFNALGGDNKKIIWYLEDGTLTNVDPTAAT